VDLSPGDGSRLPGRDLPAHALIARNAALNLSLIEGWSIRAFREVGKAVEPAKRCGSVHLAHALSDAQVLDRPLAVRDPRASSLREDEDRELAVDVGDDLWLPVASCVVPEAAASPAEV